MKLIIGLGNPGFRYINTRHNLGYATVRALARQSKAVFKLARDTRSLEAKAHIEGEQVMLALPQTYMNLSGAAVGALVEKYIREFRELLVVVDDSNLSLGTIRIRKEGSAGGHNGLKDIIGQLRRQDFPRLRLGIKPECEIREGLRDFVLERFSRGELKKVSGEIKDAVCCIRQWVASGIETAMNSWN